MFVGQFSPGPDFLLVLKNALNHGRAAAFASVAGIALGLAVHTAIALGGLAVLFRGGTLSGRIISYAGAVYLAYLAIRLLCAKAAPTEADADRQISHRSAFAQGLLTNLLNPKVVIFISAVLSQFLDADSTSTDRIVYAAIIVGQGAVMWLIFAQLLQTAAVRSRFLRHQLLFNRVFAVLLLLLAARTVLA